MVGIAKRSQKQVALRNRLDGMEFDTAVPLAVKAMFRFSHRAKDAKALWANSQSVWLGRSTFLHWSLNREFDLPWVLSKTRNAPRNKEELRDRVKSELTDYFADRLSQLPKKSTGSWLPLP